MKEIETLKHFIGRKDTYIQQKNQEWIRIKREVDNHILKWHIDGIITIGSYPVFEKGKKLRCKWVALDIDAHIPDTKRSDAFNKWLENKKEKYFENDKHIGVKIKNKWKIVDKQSKEEIRKKIEIMYSRSKQFFLCEQKYIIVEESSGGFHIWILLKDGTLFDKAYIYLQAISPKIFLHSKSYKSGKQIKKGILPECEVFPKQSPESFQSLEKSVGNGLKLPYAYDTKFKKQSKFIHFDEINKLDISNIVKKFKKLKNYLVHEKLLPEFKHDFKPVEIHSPQEIEKRLESVYNSPLLRPCIKAVMDGSYKCAGENGHLMRVATMNELLSFGLPPNVVALAFKNQKDFDYSKSYYFCKNGLLAQQKKGAPMCFLCKTIDSLGYCLPNCYKKGSDKKYVEKKEIPQGVKGWDNLFVLEDELLRKKDGTYFKIKTTRSGTTTATLLRSFRTNKRILMVAPTKRIYNKTVKEAIKIGIGTHFFLPPRTYRIKSNFETCKILYQEIDEKERETIINIFPFILKPDCTKCKLKDNCAYQRFLNNMDNYQLIYLTTAKLKALIKSPDSEIFQKILEWCDIIFIDECSQLFDINYNSTIIMDAETKEDYLKESFTALERFANKNKKYLDQELITIFVKFLARIRQIKNELTQIKEAKFITFEDINNEFHLYIEKNPNKWMKLYSAFYNFYRKSKDASIKYIVWMFLSLSSGEVYIQQIISLEGFRKLILASVDNINNLVWHLTHDIKDKLIIMTDAIIPPIDLKKAFPDIEFINVNDPMDTAKKQTIIVIKQNDPFFIFDKKTLDELMNFMSKFSIQSSSFLVFKSKKVEWFYRRLETEQRKKYKIETQDWFRGDKTIGTKSALRKMIVLGSPQPPSHSYDFVANMFRKAGYLDEYDSDEEAGKYLENYNAKSAFIQAISRVKDPNGIEKSFVLVYGISLNKIEAYLDCGVSMPKVEIFNRQKHGFLIE